MIIRYDSTAALRAAYIATHPTGIAERKSNVDDFYSNRTSGGEWYANESEADTLHLAETGDTKLVSKAEEALSHLDATVETPRKLWEPNVAGAFCSVPDYLSGRPTNMRRMITIADEHSPITILAITTSSAGISSSILAKRGTIILALVIALARIRPVTLHQLTILDGNKDGTGETIITSEINTHPLDLATACYVLTSAGFARRLTYGLATKLNNFTGGWPRGYSYGSPQKYYDQLKLKLVTDPKRCLIIGAAELHDELVVSPIPWLNKQIAYFTNVNETETTP